MIGETVRSEQERVLRVCFTDFPGPTNPEGIKRLLAGKVDFVVTDDDPDVVIFSVFGNRFLNYPGALRIFFTGENVHADFNLCDYAFGFDWMTLEDRYHRCPNFVLYDEFRLLIDKPAMSVGKAKMVTKRPRFCNFIYSNSKAHPYRDQLFHALNLRFPVASAGPHLNNTGFLRGSPSLGLDGTKDKLAFQSECRFSVAMENSSTPGYTTEKLVHALIAGTIPIYWGDPVVSRQFNPARFINCHDFESIEAVVERILEIDSDPELMLGMLRQPVFANGSPPPDLLPATIGRKLANILLQGRGSAFRRNTHVWGERYEAQRRREVAAGCVPQMCVRASRAIDGLKRSVRTFLKKTTRSSHGI
jgi:hypothetical protein